MTEDVALNDEELQRELQSLPGWEIRENWLRRTYKTPGFAHTMLLVNTVGYLAEAADHHPDLSVGYAQVTVKLQTHRVRAITTRDVALARKIHDVATWQPDADSPLDGYPKNWIH
ncbi:MAG: 4a-hydroxytetrahydrobiopterin dehydratase [Planctomycetaceae bacterium]